MRERSRGPRSRERCWQENVLGQKEYGRDGSKTKSSLFAWLERDSELVSSIVLRPQASKRKQDPRSLEQFGCLFRDCRYVGGMLAWLVVG
jgi:hypothetical protein